MTTDDKVMEFFCTCDEFCKKIESELNKKKFLFPLIGLFFLFSFVFLQPAPAVQRHRMLTQPLVLETNCHNLNNFYS